MLNLEKGKYEIRVFTINRDTPKGYSINQIMDIAENNGDICTLEYFLKTRNKYTNYCSDDLVYMCLFKLNSETETWKFVYEIR